MALYHFSILIRDADSTMLDLEDKLFQAGCDDALICFHNQSVYLEFDRESENAKIAIESAFNNIKQAGFFDLILQDTGLVSLSEIAARANSSRTAIS